MERQRGTRLVGARGRSVSPRRATVRGRFEQALPRRTGTLGGRLRIRRVLLGGLFGSRKQRAFVRPPEQRAYEPWAGDSEPQVGGVLQISGWPARGWPVA